MASKRTREPGERGDWPFRPPLTPMEARVSETLPGGTGWAYEPKWDGFRVLAWSGEHMRLDSRNRKPLLRYFPELEPALAQLPFGTVVDGEVLVAVDGVSDFDALQLRIHPAASRVAKLSAESPAMLVGFDLLALDGEDLRQKPYTERRSGLERLFSRVVPPWLLSPSTTDRDEAERWSEQFAQSGCEGIVAKRTGQPYVEKRREMVKVKRRHTAEAVVGGYRIEVGGGLGALLLGMYDKAGELHYVGYCSGFPSAQRVPLLEQFSQIEAEESFGRSARSPEQDHRWAHLRGSSWVPVTPGVVVEVSFDQVTNGRLRHAARFKRCRPDKDAETCTLEQLARPSRLSLTELVDRLS